MKRIIALAGVLILIVSTMGVGTWAYFNDIETATDNIIAAGRLNLKVGDTDGAITPFNVTAKKPTDAGQAASWLLTNDGTLAGTLAIAISAITNEENTRYKPEELSGDTTTGDTEGELGAKLKIAFWVDTNGDGNLDDGEKYLQSDGTVQTWAGGDDTTFNIANVAAAYDIVNNYDSDSFASVLSMTAGSATAKFNVEYNFPHSATKYGGTNFYTDNVAQSDGVKFTITFTLEQS